MLETCAILVAVTQIDSVASFWNNSQRKFEWMSTTEGYSLEC